MPAASTRELLERARAGNQQALEQLFEQYRAALHRWAHGRLPRWARDIADTDDLLQETLTQTLKQLPHIEVGEDETLHAYLRQAVLNRIRNELRRHARRPAHAPLDFETPAAAASPLEAVIGAERLERYENALATLSVTDREAIIGRVELGMSFRELADVLKKPSPDAARVAVTRALVKLTAIMGAAAGD